MMIKSTFTDTVKPVLSGRSKRRPKFVFQDRLSLNAGQKYCRMLNTFDLHLATICLHLSLLKTFVLSIFEWLLKTGLTVFKSEIAAPS